MSERLQRTAGYASLARRYGERIAVADAEGSITYARLPARAAALAHQLVAAGVRPRDPVASLLPWTPCPMNRVSRGLRPLAGLGRAQPSSPSSAKQTHRRSSPPQTTLDDAADRPATIDPSDYAIRLANTTALGSCRPPATGPRNPRRARPRRPGTQPSPSARTSQCCASQC